MSVSVPFYCAVMAAMPKGWVIDRELNNELIDLLGRIEKFNEPQKDPHANLR